MTARRGARSAGGQLRISAAAPEGSASPPRADLTGHQRFGWEVPIAAALHYRQQVENDCSSTQNFGKLAKPFSTASVIAKRELPFLRRERDY